MPEPPGRLYRKTQWMRSMGQGAIATFCTSNLLNLQKDPRYLYIPFNFRPHEPAFKQGEGLSVGIRAGV